MNKEEAARVSSESDKPVKFGPMVLKDAASRIVSVKDIDSTLREFF